MRIGSLFSGAGGLDMAVEAVFGGRTVWHSEIDKAASKVLAHRWPDVPNLGSITEIDWAAVEPVDVLCGGFPCQDVSAAGKRAGIKDGTRSGLWAVFADAIDALRPQYVVIENVRGLLSAAAHRTVEDDERDPLEPSEAVVGNGAGRPVLRAAGAVLGDLADLGYDARWATVAASAVGAPHRRERVFILASVADPTPDRLPGQGLSRGMDAAQPQSRRGEIPLRSDAAHASRYGWDEGRAESARLVGGFDAAVSGDEPGRVELLPTPCVVDRLATGEMTLEEWDESRRSQKERGVGSFGPRGDSLGAAILRVEEGTERPDYSTTKARRGGDEPGVALLPTPTTQDGANNGGPSQFQRNTLPLNAEVTLLPPPSTHDKTGARSPESIARMDKPFANLNDTVVNDLGVERGPEPVDVSVGEDGSSVPVLPGNGGGEDALVGAADGDGVAVDVCGAENSHSSGVPAELAGTKSNFGDLLPTPEAKNSHAGPDYARMNREGSGGHDLVTAITLLSTPTAQPGGSRSGDRIGEPLLRQQAREMESSWGKYEPAIRRWEQIVGPAPAPTEPNKNGNPRLSAAFSQWLMGWPAGWVTDPDIGISRNDQLRIVGNGVVTAQAEAALRYLLSVTHD